MRKCCEELFLTFFYSFKSMSSKGEASNREGGEGSSLMLQAMQQQFECITWCLMRFGIGWIGKTLLLLLCIRRIPKESLMLEGKKGVRTWMILKMTMRMSLKMKRFKLH